MESMLRVSQLRVALGDREIFRDVTFKLDEGETLVVLGPNGAGKTVLLKALLGLVPHEGRIAWRTGIRLGYVPQRVPLQRELPVTVGDFFELKGVFAERASDALRRVGIVAEGFLGRRLGLLSSGQFQRILIAWALVSDPDVILFDEPTGGIDLGGEETIYRLLRRAREERKIAIILVTHDLSLVFQDATRVLCMSHRKICYGDPGAILDPETLREIYGTEVKLFRHQP